MYISSHDLERFWEEFSNCIQVAQVTMHDLCGSTCSAYGVHGSRVRFTAGWEFSLDKTDGSTSLSQRYSARSTDALFN